jgi:hypothetical protein
MCAARGLVVFMSVGFSYGAVKRWLSEGQPKESGQYARHEARGQAAHQKPAYHLTSGLVAGDGEQMPAVVEESVQVIVRSGRLPDKRR